MTDLDVITMLRPELSIPTSGELAEARRRLDEAIESELNPITVRSIVNERSVCQARVSLRRTRPVTRLALVGAVAVAAAGLAVFFMAPSRTPHGGSPVVQLTAAQFLQKAAATALNQTSSAPQANEYVYSETETPGGTFTHTWLSANGANPGLNRTTTGSVSNGSNDLAPCTVAQAETTHCFPEAGYFPDMPTESSLLLAYLNKIQVIDTNGQVDDSMPGWEDNMIGKAVSYLMQTSYLLPAQQAALYSLMAQTPGFQIVPEMKDAIGRSGVGIEWTFEGDTGAIIFDPTTYGYLGVRTWPGAANFGGPYDGDALLRVAIVRSAGAMP